MNICAAAKDPARFEGKAVKGQLAIVSASPHGAYFESQCDGDNAGFLFLENKDAESAPTLTNLLTEAAQPKRSQEQEKVVEALVTGIIAPTGHGGWGLNVVKLERFRLIPVRGSGYAGLEALEASLKSSPEPR